MKLGIMKTVEVEAKAIEIHAKVRDAGCYTIYDQDGNEIGMHDGYVPRWLPGEYGDYLILHIDLETGVILNWKQPTAEDIQDMLKGEGDGEND